MAMFNSYVELPEGICWMVEICEYLSTCDFWTILGMFDPFETFFV